MKQQPLHSMEHEMARMTPSQRQAADYILKNSSEASFLTLERLAIAAGTSTATIIRLALSLGYSGFSDFQKDLQEYLRDRVAPYARLDFNAQGLAQNSALIQCSETQQQNIRETVNFLSEKSVQTCLDLFRQASKVYVIGMRTSYPIAYYLYHGLSRILGNCELMTLNTGDFFEKMMALDSSSVFVAISFPRYARHTVEVAKACKDQGAKVIAITDGYTAPLAAFADLVLPCVVHSLAFHNSIVAPIFLVDYLITSLALDETKKTKDHLESAEPLFKKLDFHIDK